MHVDERTAHGWMRIREDKLVQSLRFPVTCDGVALAGGKGHLLCIGSYRPSVRIYDLSNMTLKSERHLVADAVRVLPLSPNGEKLCVLRSDRYMEFHAKYGRHESVRLPTVCADMCLNGVRAEVIAGGAGSGLYRFNLEQGRFLRSYSTTLEDVTSVGVSAVSGLVAVGGDEKIQFIDQRCREMVKTVHYDSGVTALAFDESGIGLGVGMRDGSAYLHDLRSRRELRSVKHGTAIRQVKFNGRRMVSMDRNAMMVTEREGLAGEMKSDVAMSSFDMDGGIFFVGLEGGEIRTFVCHELGTIPLWCQMLKE
jgi:ribosome biogenesis protein ENP2